MKICGIRSYVLVAVAALALCAGSGAGAVPLLVSAKVPDNAHVSDLSRGSFKQTVSCRQTCTVSTTVAIHSAVAKRLGFTRVNTKQAWFVIATGGSKLKAKAPMTMAFTLTPEAKKILPKVKGELQVIGLVRAVPAARPSTNVQVTWITTLA